MRGGGERVYISVCMSECECVSNCVPLSVTRVGGGESDVDEMRCCVQMSVDMLQVQMFVDML